MFEVPLLSLSWDCFKAAILADSDVNCGSSTSAIMPDTEKEESMCYSTEMNAQLGRCWRSKRDPINGWAKPCTNRLINSFVNAF